ncbi:LysR family transcriptional regulator [Agarivorans gilvus]|jgi:DNA-binding transcriptional LysR family regulator|uniref:LysR family transcriptional regulator n=1 Tax=Agarivorans gilvus TaxID=680279 RepID=A0ABQ1I471_9ALTE|nr:LysR family transcriptional regulator [Agarivorans gilvus]GGB14972.1 LysR family transcriptional regulator [Agarivorans gilvus]
MGQLEEMQVFVRVVEAGSISRAAEQLGVAKSVVSRRLSALEQRLGGSLMQRTTRRLSLSETGQQFYQRSLGILAEVEQLNQDAHNQKQTLSGSLHIAVPLSFGLSHLNSAFDAFMRLHPELKLKISLSDSQHNLVAEGIDIALRIAELKDSSLRAKKITPINFVLVAAPNYLAKHGEPKHPQDLKQHQILHYSLSPPHWQLTGPDKQIHQLHYQAHVSANNGDLLRDLAIAGHGIAYAPTFIAWRAITTGELSVVLADYQLSPLHAWAVYPNTRYLPQRSRVMIDFLAQRFGLNPYWDQALSRYLQR